MWKSTVACLPTKTHFDFIVVGRRRAGEINLHSILSLLATLHAHRLNETPSQPYYYSLLLLYVHILLAKQLARHANFNINQTERQLIFQIIYY